MFGVDRRKWIKPYFAMSGRKDQAQRRVRAKSPVAFVAKQGIDERAALEAGA